MTRVTVSAVFLLVGLALSCADAPPPVNGSNRANVSQATEGGAAPDEGEDSTERDYRDELPRIAPREADEALATFTLMDGFRIDQVAAEPLVHDPVAIDFDAAGRMYVVEMRGYSEQAEENLGRVMVVEDRDGDGVYDESTVFLDGLSWPTAIICSDGGVYIGAAPEILYAKDTDGDRVADVRETVFTGFGRSNVQGLLNSFRWGFDQRIHGATSSSGGEITHVGAADVPPVSLGGRDFSFDPKTRRLRATSGGAQHGMCFDDYGYKYVCSNSDHIQQVMFEDRYLARNAYLAAPGARRSIAADGRQAEVYRTSPVEPWRIVRTRLRKKAIVPGPVEGGGRAAGYFTGATGVTIYRGSAWPAEMVGNAVIGDVGSNIVHRKVIDRSGIEFVADRARPETEFVASEDIWFRPAQFANAPDGGLYVVDVYREVIEHPQSLAPVIKKHLDLTSGRDRGRIYRIVPVDYLVPAPPRLDQASTAELVATLAHRNGWHRDTASRLLYERQDRSAISAIEELIAESELPVAKIHGLGVLAGMNALSSGVIERLLNDEHAEVRRHAVRHAEQVAGDSPLIRERLTAMVDDADVHVRYQLAFTLGEIDSSRKSAALAALVAKDLENEWMRIAVLSSLGEGAADVLTVLVEDRSVTESEAGAAFLETLAAQIGAQNRRDEVARALDLLNRASDDQIAAALTRGLSQGMARSSGGVDLASAGGSDGRFGELLGEMLSDAAVLAANEELEAAARAEAIRSLALGSLDDVRELLTDLLDSRQPQQVQSAAVTALDRFDHEAVAEVLIDAWPGYSPSLRREVTEALFARSDRVAALLEAIADGRIAARDIEAARIRQLTSHVEAEIRENAEEVFAGVSLARRGDVVEQYQSALAMEGDAARGREQFKKVCAACHRVQGVGHEIGPNLATIRNRGAESILVNVLDPNREVNPQYVNYTVITEDGRSLTGMIAGETATSITLVRAEGATDTVLRLEIEEMASSGLSIMPEGLEKDISEQAMADLLAYLETLE